MYQFYANLLETFQYAEAIAFVITLATAVLLSLLCCAGARRLGSYAVKRLYAGGKQWAGALRNDRLPQAVANLAAPFVLAGTLQDLPWGSWLIGKLVSFITLVVCMLLVNALIHLANDLYAQREVSKTRPIKGILQVVQVAAYIVFGVIAVAILLDRSPLALLGGIGAAAAVLSFVFQDLIMGLVAGIQLSGNDMVRIGDWIEMPKYSADGNVAEISMTTVKVRNFDQSITNIPAKSMVNDAFINWRGMTESGGRRIKRAISVDASSVRFCDGALLDRLGEIEWLRDALQATEQADGERTNLGVFRTYMAAYIKRCPDLRNDTAAMVRQLPAEGKGIPLEVYAFTTTTDWDEYERIQSGIFEHFYAILPQFDLKV